MANEIYLSPSPHFKEGFSTPLLMGAVIFALLPETIFGIITFGLSAFIVVLTSVVGAVFFEALFQKLAKQKITINNLSAVVTGLLLALVLPPTVPFWQVLLGDAFAIIVAKALFGGLGANVWNPALTGRAFLFVSFATVMGASWLNPGTDVISSATILSKIKAGEVVGNAEIYLQNFFGKTTGSIGETSELLILISFAFLALTHVIDWRAPFTFVGSVALLTFATGGDVLLALTSGGLLFGATFMVTDYTTVPVTKPGRLVFGLGCGVLTFLIRKFSGYPEGVMFSILFMNSLTAFLNKLTPRKYGYGKAEAKK